MPHHKSCEKRLRQSKQLRAHNRFIKSTLRSAIKELEATQDPVEAGKQLSAVSSLLDKAAKRNVMHHRTADRRKSRLALFVQKLASS